MKTKNTSKRTGKFKESNSLVTYWGGNLPTKITYERFCAPPKKNLRRVFPSKRYARSNVRLIRDWIFRGNLPTTVCLDDSNVLSVTFHLLAASLDLWKLEAVALSGKFNLPMQDKLTCIIFEKNLCDGQLYKFVFSHDNYQSIQWIILYQLD